MELIAFSARSGFGQRCCCGKAQRPSLTEQYQHHIRRMAFCSSSLMRFFFCSFHLPRRRQKAGRGRRAAAAEQPRLQVDRARKSSQQLQKSGSSRIFYFCLPAIQPLSSFDSNGSSQMCVTRVAVAAASVAGFSPSPLFRERGEGMKGGLLWRWHRPKMDYYALSLCCFFSDQTDLHFASAAATTMQC